VCTGHGTLRDGTAAASHRERPTRAALAGGMSAPLAVYQGGRTRVDSEAARDRRHGVLRRDTLRSTRGYGERPARAVARALDQGGMKLAHTLSWWYGPWRRMACSAGELRRAGRFEIARSAWLAATQRAFLVSFSDQWPSQLRPDDQPVATSSVRSGDKLRHATDQVPRLAEFYKARTVESRRRTSAGRYFRASDREPAVSGVRDAGWMTTGEVHHAGDPNVFDSRRRVAAGYAASADVQSSG